MWAFFRAPLYQLQTCLKFVSTTSLSIPLSHASFSPIRISQSFATALVVEPELTKKPPLSIAFMYSNRGEWDVGPRFFFKLCLINIHLLE